MDKYKILIIDDEKETRNIYAEVFKSNSFEVEEAEDGMEGLDKAIKNPPHIIFTGIIMPKMDGFALIEALKKNVATANIPVVMSSHMGREEDRIKSVKMGAKDFIVSDMTTPKEVVEIFKKILSKKDEYKLEISAEKLDAGRLLKDAGLKGYACEKCGANLAVILSNKEDDANEFRKARVSCPNCG